MYLHVHYRMVILFAIDSKTFTDKIVLARQIFSGSAFFHTSSLLLLTRPCQQGKVIVYNAAYLDSTTPLLQE